MTPATAASRPRQSLPASFGDDAFEAFLRRRDEPEWLIERRRAAFASFQALPWPSARDEEWRRTDIRGFKAADFAPPEADAVSERDQAAIAPLVAALAGSYATGTATINASTTQRADARALGGAILVDLPTAVREYPEIVRRYLLTDCVNPAADALSALHAAFWTNGTLLYVPKGVKLAAPLYSLVALAGAGRVDFDHTLIVLEDGAEAALVRETASRRTEARSALHVGAVEVFVGAGANLRFVNIQNWDDDVWHFSRERALVDAGGSIQWTVGGLGARLAKVNQEVMLRGERSDAQVNGVMFTTGRQHLAYFTRQDHAAPHTHSDLLYKGGLLDGSRIVWKGMIRVEKDAQRTDAYQKNDSLLLSEESRADSIPGLEIEANDVRCTHGATAGRVDEDMIFYAQARGVPRETAIRLIVEGFFANVYDRITLEPVRETLRQAVAAKLGHGK
ncbi:MAG: Fe-S cluster assembly protein SufD [Planctomycetota bacterium]|nr:Fe-S cluster assembly protein SufD [Planctomycetota bacterium]